MKELVRKFKALGDETRFNLFLLLAGENLCVSGLSKVLNISESATSQHLKILRDAELVKGEKIGYFVHYKVQKNVLDELSGIIKELSNDTVDISKLRNATKSNCSQVCKEGKLK